MMSAGAFHSATQGAFAISTSHLMHLKRAACFEEFVHQACRSRVVATQGLPATIDVPCHVDISPKHQRRAVAGLFARALWRLSQLHRLPQLRQPKEGRQALLSLRGCFEQSRHLLPRIGEELGRRLQFGMPLVKQSTWRGTPKRQSCSTLTVGLTKNSTGSSSQLPSWMEDAGTPVAIE